MQYKEPANTNIIIDLDSKEFIKQLPQEPFTFNQLSKFITDAISFYENRDIKQFYDMLTSIYQATQCRKFQYYEIFEKTNFLQLLLDQLSQDIKDENIFSITIKLLVNVTSTDPKFCELLFSNNIIAILQQLISQPMQNLNYIKYYIKILSNLCNISNEVRDEIMNNFNYYYFISLLQSKEITNALRKQVYQLLFLFFHIHLTMIRFKFFIVI